MSYNIALKTITEKQAKELQQFIENKLISINSFNSNLFDIKWKCGSDMAYINKPNYFCIGYSTLDGFKSIYFFSIIYHVAIKFNLYEDINNQKVVVLNYDDEELYYLAKSNPFEYNDSRYFSFIQISQDGVKEYKRKGWRRIFGNKISKKEYNFIKNNIEIINKSKI